MFQGIRTTGRLIWRTLTNFMADECGRMGAALSYYTVFSLPPLLILIMFLVGLVVDPATVRELVTGQIGGLLGPRGGQQIADLIRNAQEPEFGSATAVVGIIALLFGATGAFVQLQDALNTAWGVAPDPTRGDVKNFLLKRVISFAMIMSIGFLLLVSLVISAVLAAVGRWIASMTPGWITAPTLRLVDVLISLSIITLLFAAIFKYLPDAVIRWGDVIVGALVTAILFTLGKWAIGTWLGRSDPGSAYGAAGSLALALLWIYYSALAFLMGAEFTQVWAQHQGRPISPEPGAARVVRRKERIPPEHPEHGEKAPPAQA